MLIAFSPLDAARTQMAVSFIFHIFFVAFGIGLPAAMSIAEYRANRTGDRAWMALARTWSRGFAILFAVGAVSGTILSISLPLFWPRMMGRWGSLFGFPFMLEAFCFFLEAIFLGIYLYGWDRLSPWAHWWAGVAISASGLLASVFVMAANGWMQTPVGFTVTATGALANVSPWRAIANPSLPLEATHMVFAAYMVMGLPLCPNYARRLRRGTAHPRCPAGRNAAAAWGRKATGGRSSPIELSIVAAAAAASSRVSARPGSSVHRG